MRERPRSIDGEKIQVNVVLSAPLQEKLKRLRDRLSHQNASPTLAEQIELLADFALSKLEGSPKKRRSSEVREVPTPVASVEHEIEMAPAQYPRSDDETDAPNRIRALASHSRYLSAQTRREVWQRAGARCEQKFFKGERCARTHLLQIDHRFPVAWGGGNELTNLQLLCAVHNQVKSDRLPGE